MNKRDFICEMNSRLYGLPEEDVNKSIDYYCELIEDSIEDGKSEEEAVASLGEIDEIVSQIMMDIPLSKIVKAKAKPERKLKAWEIIFLVLGSPIWLSILIALFSVALAVYISIWAVVVSFYAVVLSVAVSTLAVIVGAFVSLLEGLFLNSLIFLSLALICAGLTILLFIGTNYLAKGTFFLGKLCVKGIKRMFVGRTVK